MSKVLVASCENEKVTVEGKEVEATILSQGKASSTGIVVMDGDKVYYIALMGADLITTLEKTSAALEKIASTLTDIGSGMTGPSTAPPPTLGTSVAEINAIVSELDQLKDNLI